MSEMDKFVIRVGDMEIIVEDTNLEDFKKEIQKVVDQKAVAVINRAMASLGDCRRLATKWQVNVESIDFALGDLGNAMDRFQP